MAKAVSVTTERQIGEIDIARHVCERCLFHYPQHRIFIPLTRYANPSIFIQLLLPPHPMSHFIYHKRLFPAEIFYTIFKAWNELDDMSIIQSAKKLGYCLHTLFLFTRSDWKTMMFPVVSNSHPLCSKKH